MLFEKFLFCPSSEHVQIMKLPIEFAAHNNPSDWRRGIQKSHTWFMDFFKREAAGKAMQRKIRELEQETEDD